MAWKFDRLTPDEKIELRHLWDEKNSKEAIKMILDKKVASVGNCNSCFAASVKDWMEWAIHSGVI